MNEITFEITSNEEIWELFDKKLDSNLIHKFEPNVMVEWWKIDFKMENGFELKNLSVRQMEMDVQADLSGLKKILELNTGQLRIYQFDKPISDTLEIDRLPENKHIQILRQNGLKHFFFIDFEMVTIGSFDPEFIWQIETQSKFQKRIFERKQRNKG